MFRSGWNFLSKIPSQVVEPPFNLNASQKELVVEAQLIEKVVAPVVIVDDQSQKAFERSESLESLMESVSREIRNKLVTNISAYCDCV